MPLRPSGSREGRNLRVTEAFLVERSFFGAVMAEALRNEKAVGRNAQGGVMVKAPPAPALVMRETELLLEFLVVPFDAPAHLGHENQLLQCGPGRCGREKVFCRLGFSIRPFWSLSYVYGSSSFRAK